MGTADRVETHRLRVAVRLLVGRVYPGAVAAVLVLNAAGQVTGVRCGVGPWPAPGRGRLAPDLLRSVRKQLGEIYPDGESPRVVVEMADGRDSVLQIPK